MTRSLLLLSVLLFSVPSFGEGIDFDVSLIGDERIAYSSLSVVVQAKWSGTEPAQDVVLEVDMPGDPRISDWEGTHCTPGHPIRCTMEARPSLNGGFYAYVPLPAGSYTVTARITSTTPDPNPANNVATRTFHVVALPSLRPYGSGYLPEGDAVDPGGPGALTVGVQNDGAFATNVVVHAFLLDGGHFTALSSYDAAYCTVLSPVEVQCRFGDVSFGGTSFLLPFIAPDRPDGSRFRFRITADADQDEFDPSDDTVEGDVLLRRLFAITNAADEGAGSLRQAILEAREACENIPCLLGVRAPEPLFLQPRTPLPALRGRMKVDGGPLRTTIDGSLLPAGDGLFFENGCEFRVNAMMIQNFKGHGIEGRDVRQTPYPCGYDALLTTMFVTNSELAGNERGVVTKGISATITDNVIRENARAGIFADGGYFADIQRNVVVQNGATGIFIRPAANPPYYLPAGAEVINNIVHDNGEWGIARTANGAVHITRNSIARNRFYGIDYGLDLRTPNAPNKPDLLSATYDAARGATVIRVRFNPAVRGLGSRLDVYASDSLSVFGYPEADRPIADTFRTGDVELVVPGDLRGQWITATGTPTVDLLFLRDDSMPAANATYRSAAYDTSELSDAIRVE